ncbi:PfkB family carbohydrate kinase [Hyphococcus sp.]|jgi:nucleoside 2-deoxyribosyltransferase|uniref:PfkB family carbohydrate kinase n=1 Tax=Hyphococcus sp. TaxID=2038636 RepID=UPI003D14E9CC
MIVAGGFYKERCVSPEHNVEFGSGGRAAIAIALAGVDVEWRYYCPKNYQEIVSQSLSRSNLKHVACESNETVSFTYFHPLSNPEFTPANPRQCAPIEIKGENILRFGFMEGTAVVHGDRVVFDPQSPHHPVSFSANGSTAKSLSIILNAKEALALGRSKTETKAVERIYKEEGASVIIVKGGAKGCRIYVDGAYTKSVPPYRTERVYKIGSGDVFSAAFAFHWAEKGLPPEEAADAASRCVARYCNNRLPSVVLDEDTAALEAVVLDRKKPGKVYVAGPFFTMAELWLIEEACLALAGLGVKFFSPYHEAGIIREHTKEEIDRVVAADLKGLDECTALLAVMDGCDPGTVFEVGYAVRKGIPVVALSQNPKEGDQTMVKGSQRSTITDDFASAIYRVAWESGRK